MLEPRSKIERGTPEFLSLCKYFSERSPQPMVAVEGPGHVVRYFNPAFAKLIEQTSENIIGRPFTKVVPEGETNQCGQLLDRVFLTGKPEVLVDQKHTQATLAYWTYSMWPIIGDENLAAGVMIQVTDVTGAAVFRGQLTEMNQALALSGIRQHELTETGEKLNSKLTLATEAKSLFLANMSHEIRTPLAAILGYSELLREPDLSSDEKSEFIETINRNGRELTRIIDDILDLSKVEAGSLTIEKIKISLPDLLTDITTSLSIKAKENSLSFVVESMGQIPETILTDPTRLRQILLNIVGNALKFTRIGSVTMKIKLLPVESDSWRLAFIIEDTGCGISSAGQSKLFNHFSQADSSTTRKFGGTGLGLILSRNLARALGGDIVLQSSVVDKGSIFVVTIDCGRIDKSSLFLEWTGHKKKAITAPALLAKQYLEGIRVLLAEDAPDNRILITRILTNSGAAVDVAENGIVAIEKANEAPYDLILMDIQMPLLDGHSAAKYLRAQGYQRPIIALTAHALTEEREKSETTGFNEHLTKPIDMKHLIETVARFSKSRPSCSSSSYSGIGGLS